MSHLRSNGANKHEYGRSLESWRMNRTATIVQDHGHGTTRDDDVTMHDCVQVSVLVSIHGQLLELSTVLMNPKTLPASKIFSEQI